MIIILCENLIVASVSGWTNELTPVAKSHLYQLNVEINFKMDSTCRKYIKQDLVHTMVRIQDDVWLDLFNL